MNTSPPRILRYLLAFLILTPLWILVLKNWIRPEALDPETPVILKLGYGLLPTSALLLGIFQVHSSIAHEKEDALRRKAQREHDETEKEEATAAMEHQRISLEVLGLGLAVEMFRQTWIWEAMTQPPSVKSILLEDIKTFPWSREEKEILNGQRAGITLEHALSWFVKGWPIPAFMVGPAKRETGIYTKTAVPYLITPHQKADSPEAHNHLVGNLKTAWQTESLQETEFLVIDTLHDDIPEESLDHVFEFMETNSEVPAVLLFVQNGNPSGANDANVRSASDTEFYSLDELTESFTALVLARRDRIEALRAHIANDESPCDPLTPFWAKRKPSPVGAFRGSEFMPTPWTQEQFNQIDQLPVLGHIHRPQKVSFLQEGKAIGYKAKVEAFTYGWNAAMATLPEGGKPSRVVFDCGPGHEGRVSPLAIALDDLEPHLDIRDPSEGVDLTRHLGDTGASSFFVSTALGVIASHRHDDFSVVVSFRKRDGASIMLVGPPTLEERQKQHPGGEDPLNLKLVI